MDQQDLLFLFLKDVKSGKEPKFSDYEGITKEFFADVVEIAIDERFVKNASVTRSGQGGKNVICFTDGVKITLPGLRYILKKTNKHKAAQLERLFNIYIFNTSSAHWSDGIIAAVSFTVVTVTSVEQLSLQGPFLKEFPSLMSKCGVEE